LDDVPEGEKTRRIVALQQLQKDIQTRLLAASVGQTVEVLVDSSSRRRAWELAGRTSGNTVVNFPGDPSWMGRLLPVAIRRSGPHSVWGEAVTGEAPVDRVAGHA
jgi:tRNA-2-methylthio-N6-dimethylallyladenosine synthase